MLQTLVRTAERVRMWVPIHLNVRVKKDLKDQLVQVKGSIVARHRKAPHSLNILGCRFINFKTPAFKLSKSSSTGCLKKTLWQFNRLLCITNLTKQFNFYIG